MTENGTATRQLPPTQERILFDLEAAHRAYDGRTGKALEGLQCLGFIQVVAQDEKNPRKATWAITDRGKYALNRVRRGVDPYLRMTE